MPQADGATKPATSPVRPVPVTSPAQALKRFVGHGAPPAAVAFSPDGKYLLSCAGDQAVVVWDIEKGRDVRVFVGHEHGVFGAAWSPDGHRAYSARGGFAFQQGRPNPADCTVRIWNVTDNKSEGHIDLGLFAANCIVVLPDGQRALVGGGSREQRAGRWVAAKNQVLVIDLAARKVERQFAAHDDAIMSVAVSADGRLAATGALDKTVAVWEVETGREVARFKGHTDRVVGVAISPDGKTVASASLDATARTWDVAAGRPLARFDTPKSWTFCVAFTPDGKSVVSGHADKSIRIWDPATGREQAVLHGSNGHIICLDVSRDGRFIASGGRDKLIQLWEMPPRE